MPKLCVIIPVYNVEKYLHHCIDSVLESTFHNFELLLIDDGSKDNSGAICDEYAAKDNRVKVYHVENGGVSKARNMGIEHSTAPWLTFIDADDIVLPSYLERLYSAVEAHPEIDLVHAGCMLYEGDRATVKEFEYEDKYSDDKSYLFWKFRGLPFSKLFKREIIFKEGIRFDEKMKSQEDMFFMLDYVYHVKSYVFLNQYEYFHRCDNTTSIMHTEMCVTYENALHASHHYFESVDKYIQAYNISEKYSIRRKKHVGESLSFAIYTLFLSKDFSFRERTVHLKNDFSTVQLSYLKCAKGKKNLLLYLLLAFGFYKTFNWLMSNMLSVK